jgi:hypothetical protein
MIEQERHRWMPFRRALSKEDQERLIGGLRVRSSRCRQRCCLGGGGGFEAVLLEHEKRVDEIMGRHEELKIPPRF